MCIFVILQESRNCTYNVLGKPEDSIADVAISKRPLLFTVWMQLRLRSHQNFYLQTIFVNFCGYSASAVAHLRVMRKRSCTLGMINRGRFELATSPTAIMHICLLVSNFIKNISNGKKISSPKMAHTTRAKVVHTTFWRTCKVKVQLCKYAFYFSLILYKVFIFLVYIFDENM